LANEELKTEKERGRERAFY